MAAPLKNVMQKCSQLSKLSVVCVRHASRSDGLPPWTAQRVPSGQTFTAIKMAKCQNKEVWRKREELVNRPWKDMLINYNKDFRNQVRSMEEPPKLLMVRQIKTTKGCSKRERNVLRDLGLTELRKPNIVKNKENVLGQIRAVNHLVEVFPVTFPYGEPKTPEDLESAYLCDNGAFVIKKKIGVTEPATGLLPPPPQPVKLSEEVHVTDKTPENVFEIKQDLIDRQAELSKKRYMINREHYPSKYIYKHNQDGKEFRYKGSEDIGHDTTWY